MGPLNPALVGLLSGGRSPSPGCMTVLRTAGPPLCAPQRHSFSGLGADFTADPRKGGTHIHIRVGKGATWCTEEILPTSQFCKRESEASVY